MERTGIVLQARLGSTRLPGKVLAPLDDRTILEHCVRRLARSGWPLVIATTDRSEDDAIERAGRLFGVPVHRGPVDDVLARFIGAAETFGFAEVIRATADNPFVDMDAPHRTSESRQRTGADHVVECGLPVGAAVEAVSLEALRRADTLATDPYDREHVTSLVRRDGRFRAVRAVAPGHLRRTGLRLTVDTAEDLAAAREIHAAAASPDGLPHLSEVVRAADVVFVRHLALQRTRKGA
jgi:spore coat polysaccharide biosynthesis protein SpsF (cytidylyltransferase family)